MTNPVTVQFVPGFRLIDGSDLNTLVSQVNSALTGGGSETFGNITVNGTSVLTGNTTAGNIAATGLLAVTGNETVSGNLTVTTNLGVTGNSTITGNETVTGTLGVTGLASFTLQPKMPRSTVGAAGTVLGNATATVAGVVTVTGADGTKGVALPVTPPAGTTVFLKNNTAAILKVYPDAAATINAIGANGPISMASLTSAIFMADSTTQWFTIPLLPS